MARVVYGLCFLKPETVEERFVFDIFPDNPENKKADYIVNTYIDGSATFPPEIWADPDIEIKHTMNGCESSNPTSTYGE